MSPFNIVTASGTGGPGAPWRARSCPWPGGPCGILRLKNPCVVSPPSVTRDCLGFRREVRLVSRVDFRSSPAPRAPRQNRGSGWVERPHQLGGTCLGSGVRSPLGQACDFRDTINTHPGNPQMPSGRGVWRPAGGGRCVTEIWTLVLMKSHLWSRAREA